ncbi:YjjG family noncanonical pyrimidine nucleotidase [Schinkia azotoformans]|uniref:Putative hydrolase n=1 Tax=Schinkia azotoformans LMG 9581 TaxID=1131731 RepID=K6D5X1_SCHAZ|nr:YjjG family noncanonical pyrimidine nucleotidase [Schinkia azotoformans]EKN67917.1 putative hydrolase [Schinkia azotoformans LMG 9581]MEC1637064.1 YjjG family noncanonical pyrimidine nucleotidase [Schinkia azotoformans]MEC1719910.1 YjjG family noncanonical pyrimidine nucleotidase [Schinkia azotoformans]MEC1945491.1 YjjG family noncanonical pyrimidine nucleotidase [Schinkia azotoformans]MED4351335.1 YjjG family noncanonical pyrimidine nucleotidase [Schinkia azotoformans]
MKRYKTLLFDVDDTLLDFGAAESAALRQLFKEQKLTLTPEIESHYKKFNKGLWWSYEAGEISRDELLNSRFSKFFREYGQEVDGILLEKRFRSYLREGYQLINGAFELIKDLEKEFDLYIITNGVSETQDKRLRASGLHPLFKNVFVSDDIGYQKPRKEFFDYVFSRIPKFTEKQSLVIGDSLGSDIKGAELAGLDSCWFNPEKNPNKTTIKPTYEIRKLNELYKILS